MVVNQDAAEDRLTAIFGALADPTRRAILARLKEGEASVNTLAAPFAISLPAVSRHLKVLERAGLIVRGREAQWRPCRLDAEPIKEVAAWASGFHEFWEESFEKLDDLLAELREESEPAMQKVVPFLWFNTEAEEAMNYYASIFPDSKVVSVVRGPDGKVLTGTFHLAGQEFMALNGGPQFKFTEAISLFVKCETQEEVDRLWAKLTADGGEESMCGWLKDKYGLSWQIIPNRLGELLGDEDPERAGRAMQAMLGMRKIDVAALERAAGR